ncbi:MAG: translocation/assembly module TamB domain-containing protein [Scytolyngbya sp. HA4215-MV1]|jgi:translocation and assembly module TamB|nr:translocation/assembly module TamB domain-containing protein [Scytolyngbya sp. HA4215-MV1]
MTNPPNPEQTPEPQPEPRPTRRLRALLLNRKTLIVGGILVAGISVSVWWLDSFVYQRLGPLVEESLSKSLKRPVRLGRVERFSLTGLRLGRSSVPATANDPDHVTIEAVEVGFNPLQVLLTRKLSLDLTVIQPNLYLEQDKKGLWVAAISATEKESGPVQTEVNAIRIRDAVAVLVPYPKPGHTQKQSVTLNQMNGIVRLFDQGKRITYETRGRSITGGKLDLNGETLVKPGLTKLDIQFQNLLATEVDRLIRLPISLPSGRLNGNLEAQLQPNQKLPVLNGTAQFSGITLQVPALPQRITQAEGGVQFRNSVIWLDSVKARFGKIPVLVQGNLDPQKNFNLAVQVRRVALANVVETLALKLPVPTSGKVDANLKLVGPIQKPVLLGEGRLAQGSRIDRIELKSASARFILTTTDLVLRLPQIQAFPVAGGRVAGRGLVKLGNRGGLVLDLQADGISGDAIARTYGANLTNLTIGAVAARTQVFGAFNKIQTIVNWQAPQGTYPARGEVVVAGGEIFLRNTTLNVAGGTVNARARIADGKWQASVNAAQIPLNRFSPDLRGRLSTVNELQLVGSVASFSPSAIRAMGKVNFSQGIALVTQPLTATFRWNGERILLDEAITPGFNEGAAGVRARGSILAKLEGTPAIGPLDLNVQTRGLDLQTLPVALPKNIKIAGLADFTGKVTGTPAVPSVVSTAPQYLRLRNFVLNDNAFESPLVGTFAYQAGKGLDLAVRGTNDRLALQLNGNNELIAFELRQGEMIAKGERRGGELVIDQSSRISLNFLRSLSGAANAIPPIEGILRTPQGLRVNPVDQSLVGRIEIDNLLIDPLNRPVTDLYRYTVPRVGTIQGDRFVGDIRYKNGVATLTNGELQQGEIRDGKFVATSRFLLNGEFVNGPDPKFNAQLTLAPGSQIQDVFKTVQLYDLQSLGQILSPPTQIANVETALQTQPAGLPQASLINQIRRLAEVEELLAKQRAARETAAIPDLQAFKGEINGTLNVEGSLRSGINVTADLDGQNWRWEIPASDRRANTAGKPTIIPFAKQVAINLGQGSKFANGTVSLLPLRFVFDETVIDLNGTLGEELQAQLRVNNLPVATIERLLPPDLLANFPLDIDGKLVTTATLDGTRVNPQITGELKLADASLNGQPIQSDKSKLNFRYIDARLDFDSTLLVTGNEPLYIAGNLPLPLPFSSVTPSSDIKLRLNVKDEGLALLNLFTTQVAWLGGKGQVQLDVSGTLFQPIASGFIDFTDATLSAQALSAQNPADQQLTGVTGKAIFSGGLIRITDPGIRGQYRRGGQVTVNGAFPLLGELSEQEQPLTISLKDIDLKLRGRYEGGVSGNIQLLGNAFSPAISGSVTLLNGQALLPSASEGGGTSAPDQTGIEFRDFKIVLGNNVRVTSQPILSFVARGDLTLNGSLNAMAPSGKISLLSGQVNLFTSQFVLARGYNQTATFYPTQGLDPTLDVRLITSVPEVTRSRVPTETLPSEILDTPTTTSSLGAFQTVRIQASVSGPASKLQENLELTSNPARSREEIVTLLGRGITGDGTLALANLAGSALLNNVQDVIGKALGLSEFRVYPTRVTDDKAGNDSTLGLAAEAGIDVTKDLSVSILRILTADQPTQFGLRYRINDNLRVRSFTDLTKETGAVVEYEVRF